MSRITPQRTHMPRHNRINHSANSPEVPRNFMNLSSPLARSPTDSLSSRTSLNGANLSRFNALNGDDRRSSMYRYWRFNEWSRHAAMTAAVEEEDTEESASGGEKSSKKKGDEKDEKVMNVKPADEEKVVKPPEGVETPPGFRWVYIEIE